MSADVTKYLDQLPAGALRHDERPAGMHTGCDCGTEQADPDPWRKGFTRRRLVQGSAAMVAALGLQTVTTRFAFSPAAAAELNADTIVIVNLRGGMDGLSSVVPTFEKEYYAQRPNIAVPEGAALALDRGFGLHPSLVGMHDLYKKGMFAPVVAVGTPDRTLSHFEAMDTLERGTSEGLNTSGWMNRVLQARGQEGVFSAVQFGANMPLALTGDAPALSIAKLQTFGLAGYDEMGPQAEAAFAKLYKGVDQPFVKALSARVSDTLGAIDQVTELNKTAYQPAGGAEYPGGAFGDTLKDAARLIKADLGLTLASIDVGGFDHHTNHGPVGGGAFTNHMNDLDKGLTAFVKDLGDLMGGVTVVVMSEFGRTLRENGTNGSDHGHGQSMWLLGGGVKGGTVHGTWPGVAKDDLFLNGSIAGTTDYRDVLADVLANRGKVGSFSKVFPDYKATTSNNFSAKRA
ncbi:MAG: DUF1501 domain-containing protein [Actinomycetota bacterium]